MNSLQLHCCLHFIPPQHRLHLRCSAILTPRRTCHFLRKISSFRESFVTKANANDPLTCFARSETRSDNEGFTSLSENGETERPPFDINLAVILAGFAFESYATPPENIGKREVNAAGCNTLYLSESFVREVYDGQLFIKLKRGFDFPALDPWGTSDPYVVMDLDGQVAKSKTKWGTKEPKWNEDFVLNIKLPPAKKIQIAAWDANLVTPHKRMGNSEVDLDCLCDGNVHEVLVELDGIGGGGKVQLEIRYKGFEEIEDEKKWWKLPFISEFLKRNEIESVLSNLVDSDAIPARQFVEYAFGQLKSLNDTPLKNNTELGSNNNMDGSEGDQNSSLEDSLDTNRLSEEEEDDDDDDDDDRSSNGGGGSIRSESNFWDSFPDIVSQNIVQKLGLPSPKKLKLDGMEILEKFGLQSRKTAEAGYIESGLATANTREVDDEKEGGQLTTNAPKSSITDMKNATQELLKQADNVFGALMVVKAVVPQLSKNGLGTEKVSEKNGGSGVRDDISRSSKSEKLSGLVNVDGEDEKNAEEMKTLFSSAESAMEAWAMLATALGHPSFIKSEFEKLCFLDNDITDTQVAIWRDARRKRVVIAFRGTEQTKWKDLQTDLMLVPVGLNPERIGGDFKEEVQVHSGFLSAYDSVRIRIISLLKMAIGYIDDVAEREDKWHVYVTGHSLGGALATLLAIELASSQLAKRGAITVTMYNFGSPRVGNKKFADVYNQKVKDSWRVVNHRDIIPTVPRLMGYCHVAHPVFLGAGDVENIDFQKDGYHGEVIGEATPDILVSRFMKGEKELVEQILQTEIKLFNAIRDGSALMQHMEDFYYITLLESVKLYYKNVEDLEGVEKTI
ncbi:putative triglyceride lipase [Hirschfeldia incana]|nr:putative triglyceride lipase [Hirschfeldia incana]